MKAIGVVRHVDSLGRIVIPMELRRTQEIKEGDPMEIFVDDNKIVLRKYAPGCSFCGTPDGISYVLGKAVCTSCAKEIAKVLKTVKV